MKLSTLIMIVNALDMILIGLCFSFSGASIASEIKFWPFIFSILGATIFVMHNRIMSKYGKVMNDE